MTAGPCYSSGMSMLPHHRYVGAFAVYGPWGLQETLPAVVCKGMRPLSVTMLEVIQLVRTALPKGRQQDVTIAVLPHPMSLEELCTAEPWAKFVLAEEVAQRLWVAFVDEEPDMPWDHRSRLLLVDDDIAEVLMDLSVHFRPSFYDKMQPLNHTD